LVNYWEYVHVYLCNYFVRFSVNPLNAKLNPICHLLALLWTHPILHVSGIRVKSPLPSILSIPDIFAQILYFNWLAIEFLSWSGLNKEFVSFTSFTLRHGIPRGIDRRSGTSADGTRRWPRSNNHLLVKTLRDFIPPPSSLCVTSTYCAASCLLTHAWQKLVHWMESSGLQHFTIFRFS